MGADFLELVISDVSYLDRVNISIAGLSIEQQFRLDHVRLGWVFSAWVLGYAPFQAALAWLLVDPDKQLKSTALEQGRLAASNSKQFIARSR
jgi:hypothetical protein